MILFWINGGTCINPSQITSVVPYDDTSMEVQLSDGTYYRMTNVRWAEMLAKCKIEVPG